MNSMETVKRYTIDDLPAFSSWPARLLGLEAWSPRQKTAAEVIREYDHGKWGALLMRMDSAPAEVTVDDEERWSLEGVAQSLCSVGDRVELLSPAAGRQRHILMVESVLRRYLPASALVELGAGYGSIILRVSREREFADLPLFAGEYTASGIELIRRLSQAEGIPMTVGRCDLGSNRIVNFAVPEGALVFTSMAVHYIPLLSTDYVQGIAALRPTGVLRRRYIEVNDYNRNLVSLLRAQQAEGALRILEELPAVLGVNPLLPVSVIVWSPRQ